MKKKIEEDKNKEKGKQHSRASVLLQKHKQRLKEPSDFTEEVLSHVKGKKPRHETEKQETKKHETEKHDSPKHAEKEHVTHRIHRVFHRTHHETHEKATDKAVKKHHIHHIHHAHRKHHKAEGAEEKEEKNIHVEPEPERPSFFRPMRKLHPKKFSLHLRGLLYRKLRPKAVEESMPQSRAGRMLWSKRQSTSMDEYPKFFVIPSRKFVSIPTGARNMIYPLIKPYSYANIRYNEREEAMEYHVVEPKLSEEEGFIINKIREGLIQVIDIGMGSMKEEKNMIAFLEERVQYLLSEYGFELADDQYLKLMYYIYRDFIGLNEIEPLLRDLYIEDISCDGTGIPLYVVHQKLGSLRTNIIFSDEKKLRELVIKMAERCDRYISYAEPLLDGSLHDGTRVQASLADDVTTKGPTFSIRKFPERPYSPVDMVRLGTASPEMLAYLWFVIENGANVLIAGGTATGKTSLLNSISLFIVPEAKIVSIEDTRELNLPHENWVPGVSRMGFTGTKVGEVSMFDLLKESFRQNPDYLIVGEVRGEEASVMFQGMASGHTCISTMHAGSVDDLLKRLQTRPISLPPSLMETLDLIILMTHAREKGKAARRVKEIIEMERVDPESGRAQTTKVFEWNIVSDEFEYRGASHLLNKISQEKGIPMEKIIAEIETRRDVIEWLMTYDLKDWKEVAKYIVLYYRDKEKVLKAMGKRHRRRHFGIVEVGLPPQEELASEGSEEESED